MATRKPIGTKIAKRRQVLGVTQEELARELSRLTGRNVSKSTVANWERGRHYPQRYLGALEEVLGVELDGDGEEQEVYTDPAELAIWNNSALGDESHRLEIIATLRRARRDHGPGRHERGA